MDVNSGACGETPRSQLPSPLAYSFSTPISSGLHILKPHPPLHILNPISIYHLKPHLLYLAHSQPPISSTLHILEPHILYLTHFQTPSPFAHVQPPTSSTISNPISSTFVHSQPPFPSTISNPISSTFVHSQPPSPLPLPNSDYCCGEQEFTPAFREYVKQRGYHLLSVANYGKTLENSGFKAVQVCAGFCRWF